MAQRFRPLPLRLPGFAFCLCAGALSLPLASPRLNAAPAETKPAVSQAAELSALRDATAAEEWLANNIPVGAALADAPEFFADADEVFFDAEENLLVFVYRSSDRSRWIAWVSFDAERVGVVHTAAIDL
jgi:hypothetical protein